MQKRHKRTVAIVKKNIITGLESAKDSYDETEVFDDDEILVSHRVSSFKSLTSFFFIGTEVTQYLENKFGE